MRWRTPPAYRERAWGFHRDERTYRLQHIASGRIVLQTKLEMREKYGLRPPSLDSLVAGRIQTSTGLAARAAAPAGREPAVDISLALNDGNSDSLWEITPIPLACGPGRLFCTRNRP